ncbi:MAG TPA: NADH-quinone oxidoreductase subunit NuoG [Anaerolineales bacterium]|nr:NADH-quinone oxidoreductase subunit NuoG [Anaerolineales bacterium]
MSEANNVTLTIDKQTVRVPAGTLVVDAAKKAGIDIPVFCYHPKMEPVGMCRMCLVEIGRPSKDRETGETVLDEHGDPVIQFGPKLDTGCTIEVSEGMVVRGFTEKVMDARLEMLEFILTSHPLDCPICDKGGECPLQNLTMRYGPGKSRFLLDDKIRLAKQLPLGELIYLDRERCIQCARCTRFQDEIVDDPVIGFFNRGRALEIVTFSDPGFDSYWSGNTTDICPVGALTTVDFRFEARPWELNSAASICNQCPVGCNFTFNTRREAKTGGDFVIKRVMPRQNEAVNEIWICDKGRFSSYHFSEREDRLTQPMIRRDGMLQPASWGEALDFAAGKLEELGSGLVALAGGRLSNEDLFNLKSLAEHLGGKAVLNTHVAGGDIVSRHGFKAGTDLAKLGKGDAVLVIACDLEEEAPIWWLRVKQAAERGARLVVANPRRTKLDASASDTVRYEYGEELSALDRLPERFTEAGSLAIFYGAEGLGLAGSAALAAALADLLSGSGVADGPCSGLVAVHGRPNDQGAWELGLRPAADLAGALAGAKAVYIAAADPAGDGVFEKGDRFVIVQDVLLTPTAELADVVLPASGFMERDGSYTSGERRVQRFYTTLPPPPETRPDFTITAQVAARVGLELEGRHAGRLFAMLAEAVPAFSGLSFNRLAEVEEQWPIVGREDMYYGGTTYANYQGLGAHLVRQADGEDVWAGETRAGEAGAQKRGARDAKNSGLLAVPVTRLYDRGTVISQSNTLAPRLAERHLGVHPETARKHRLLDGQPAHIRAGGREAKLVVRVTEAAPEDVLLVPRSMGLDLDGPSEAAVKSLVKEVA